MNRSRGSVAGVVSSTVCCLTKGRDGRSKLGRRMIGMSSLRIDFLGGLVGRTGVGAGAGSGVGGGVGAVLGVVVSSVSSLRTGSSLGMKMKPSSSAGGGTGLVRPWKKRNSDSVDGRSDGRGKSSSKKSDCSGPCSSGGSATDFNGSLDAKKSPGMD